MLSAISGNELVQLTAQVPILEDSFHGVFSYDYLANINSLPSRKCCIINTNYMDDVQAIGHWFSVFRVHQQSFELLDSCGVNSPKYDDYAKWFSNYGKLKVNRTPLQSPTSSACGLICVLYCLNRSLDYVTPFENFLENLFPGTFQQTETYLWQIFGKHLIELGLSHDGNLRP